MARPSTRNIVPLLPTAATSSIKTYVGLARASTKTVMGVTQATVKTFTGVANQ